MQIELNHVAIGYQSRPCLVRGISITLRTGNLVVIAGDNGVGKTTFLKTIAGILPTREGSLTPISPSEIGFANAETMRFIPAMTGNEIIAFFEKINNSSLDASSKEISIYKEFAEKTYQDMSTGMKQVLKILIASLDNKKILLLDEPLKGLAENAKNDLIRFLKTILKNKIIVVTAHSFQDWENFTIVRYQLRDEKLERV